METVNGFKEPSPVALGSVRQRRELRGSMATMMTPVCSLGAKSRQSKNKNVLSLDTMLPSAKLGILGPWKW
jgi:hypothetical protein